jgi:hypothetical protein
MSVGEYVTAIIESVKNGCADVGVKPPESIEFKVGVFDDGLVGGTHPVSFFISLANVDVVAPAGANLNQHNK